MGVTLRLSEEQKIAILRLYKLASEHDNGQAKKIGRFLVGLYDGYRFPFDLVEFRALDQELFTDCLLTLMAGYNNEIHKVIGTLLSHPVDFEQLAVWCNAKDRSHRGGRVDDKG